VNQRKKTDSLETLHSGLIVRSLPVSRGETRKMAPYHSKRSVGRQTARPGIQGRPKYNNLQTKGGNRITRRPWRIPKNKERKQSADLKTKEKETKLEKRLKTQTIIRKKTKSVIQLSRKEEDNQWEGKINAIHTEQKMKKKTTTNKESEGPPQIEKRAKKPVRGEEEAKPKQSNKKKKNGQQAMSAKAEGVYTSHWKRRRIDGETGATLPYIKEAGLSYLIKKCTPGPSTPLGDTMNHRIKQTMVLELRVQ